MEKQLFYISIITIIIILFINIFHCFSEKVRLDVSSESYARQTIHAVDPDEMAVNLQGQPFAFLMLQV